MAFEVILTAHDIIDGSIFQDGIVYSDPINLVQMETLQILSDAMLWRGGWNSQRDVYFMPTTATSATRTGLRQTNRKTGSVIDTYQYNNTTVNRLTGDFNGRDVFNLTQAGTPHQLIQYGLERLANVSGGIHRGQFDTTTKSGTLFDGIRWYTMETVAGTDTMDTWDHSLSTSSHLVDTSNAGTVSAVDITYDGRNIYWLRETATTYRLLVRDKFGEGIVQLVNRTPSGFRKAHCLSCDGRYLYVGWSTGSGGSSLGDYGTPP